MTQGDSLMARKLANARERKGFAPASCPPPADVLPFQDGTQTPQVVSSDKRFAGSYFETLTTRQRASQKITIEVESKRQQARPWSDPNYLPELLAKCDAKDEEKQMEKRTLLQNNREFLRQSLRQQQMQRLQLEIDSKTLSQSALFSQYGISPKEPKPVHRDPNEIHVLRASKDQVHFQQLMAHREFERSKLAARKAARESLEATLTPFKQTTMLSTKFGSPVAKTSPCEENDLNALREVDAVFAERQQECRDARLSGRRTKPSFDKSLDHRQLTKSAFTFPIYN